jgi:hypothetical protein
MCGILAGAFPKTTIELMGQTAVYPEHMTISFA